MIAFTLLAPVMVVAALGLLFARKAVHCALLLAVVMISMAVLYAVLDAPFLFAVQIIVYTGAILMLFLFVLMLVGVDSSDSIVETIRGQRVWAGIVGLLFGLTLAAGVAQVALGPAVGLAKANEGGNVPSIFINFNIPQQMVRALEAELDLPPGFRLVPSRMTDSQPGKYMLTLNIYEMPDVLTGMPVFRAEWSVYVQDQNDPTASGGYLMVIDLNSNSPSLDPYNGSTPASDFVYQEIDGHLSAAIAGLDATPKFSIGFELPPPGSPPIVLSEAWILSNDRIYWRNGVYDRLLYNGLLLDADVVEVDPASAIIDDRTPWARFVDATPLQVAVFRNPLQFAVNPWYNVEERCQSGFRSTGKTHRDSYASDPSARSTSNPQL